MPNKTWFVTGISSGIGKALSEAIIQHGDYVIGTFRSQEQVDAFNEQNEGKGFAYLLDVTDQVAIQSVVEHIKVRFGTVDVLVNNAGTGFIGAVEEASDEETRFIFEVNVFSALNLTRSILPMMRANKSGHIVQISSQAGIRGGAGFGIYNSSKFALEGFSEALALELKPLGIHVTIVEPGPFRTGFAGSRLKQAETILPDYQDTAGKFREMLKNVNGKQEGDPEKAALAIINHIEQGAPTLRLPLGKVTVGVFQAKIDALQGDLDTNRGIAESVIFTT